MPVPEKFLKLEKKLKGIFDSDHFIGTAEAMAVCRTSSLSEESLRKLGINEIPDSLLHCYAKDGYSIVPMPEIERKEVLKGVINKEVCLKLRPFLFEGKTKSGWYLIPRHGFYTAYENIGIRKALFNKMHGVAEVITLLNLAFRRPAFKLLYEHAELYVVCSKGLVVKKLKKGGFEVIRYKPEHSTNIIFPIKSLSYR